MKKCKKTGQSTLLDRPSLTSRDKLSSKQIVEACGLAQDTHNFVIAMAEKNSMSGRALVNTLRVARTIADLGQSQSVCINHVSEALGFRIRDGVGGL